MSSPRSRARGKASSQGDVSSSSLLNEETSPRTRSKRVVNKVKDFEGRGSAHGGVSSTDSEECKSHGHGGDVKDKIDYVAYGIAALFAFITVYMYPGEQSMQQQLQDQDSNTHNHSGAPSVGYVFYYGWITAISTGLGVLPFLFVTDASEFWIGMCNAIAGGMMTAASYSLAYEGITLKEHEDDTAADVHTQAPTGGGGDIDAHHRTDFLDKDGMTTRYLSHALHAINTDYDATAVLNSSLTRTLFGLCLGILFIVITGWVLQSREDLSVGNMVRASATKMVLIVFVMTLHSLSEGIGIGVAFGASHARELGKFISTSLAVHNIPEGLAVALVLFPMKMSKLRVALWAIFTSLPQPLMAIPAFLFVKQFLPWLPVGLGFASGAMAYVALFELVPEAVEGVNSKWIVAGVALSACAAMLVIQDSLH